MASKLKLTELLYPTSTTPAITINADDTVTFGAPTTTITNLSATNLAYTGTLTGGTGVINIGSGQVYKDASGNVGIGTASPTQRLSVSGSILGTQSVTIGSDGLYQAGSLYSDVNWGMILRAKQASPGQANFGFMNSAGTELMRIDTSGNLLVGITSGTSRFTLAYPESQEGIRLRNTNATAGRVRRLTADFNNTFYVLDENTVGVFIAQGATSWTAISDERFKDIIEPIESAASKVSSLRAVIGKYKTDEDGVKRSFLIAQDVQAVFPEAVDTTDPDKLGLRYTELIPLLTAAIKEQQEMITELKAEFDAYKLTHP